MRKPILILTFMIVLSFVLWKCSVPHSGPKNLLPQDVLTSCTVSPDTFKTWFASGAVTPNGLVTPANSVTFPHRDNCDFYQWSERMFLWIISPSNGKTVLESPVFYNVSPEDSAGNRVLIPNTSNTILRMTGHIAKVGPNRLPVIRDKKGRLFEMEIASDKETVKDAEGKVVEVAQVKATSKNTFLFLDAKGNTINQPKAIIQHHTDQQRIVHRFTAGNKFIFLDGSGNIIQSEEGQATGDVLMAKNGSLVYYLTMVNDVYAWYLTLSKTDHVLGKKFPTTALERDAIIAYALAHHVKIPDPNALAMELKSSWVEASSLKDTSNYITINAIIPTYDTTAKQWTPIRNGEKTVKMALVGMHVVGSVAGHPEMIWATFEHEKNTPNAAYAYLNQAKQTQTVPQDTGSDWLFSSNAADTAFNVSHMGSVNPVNGKKSTDTIFAKPNFNISASNTLRTMPWGSAADSLTNPENGSSAASNSEVISINNSIQQLLAGNDIRKRYLFIGATWTEGGAPPTGVSYGSDKKPGVAIGTSVLANSTMETYFQTTSTSCLTCHSGFVDHTLSPDTISHIFSALQPIIDKYNLKQKSKKDLK